MAQPDSNYAKADTYIRSGFDSMIVPAYDSCNGARATALTQENSCETFCLSFSAISDQRVDIKTSVISRGRTVVQAVVPFYA